MKIAVYSLAIFLSIGITLAKETLARFGLESSYLLMALVALAATALLSQRSVYLTGAVVALCVVINVPSEMLGSFEVDKDILVAALIAIVILPVVHNIILR